MTKTLTWGHLVADMGLDNTSRALAATVNTMGADGQWLPCHATVDFESGIWKLENSEGTWSRRPDGGCTFSSGDLTNEVLHDEDNRMPHTLALFFPSELPIWGRETDEWSVAHATVLGDEICLSLRHMSDSDLGAEATISRRWCVATEFITPWSETVLQGVEPIRTPQPAIQETLFEL